MRGRVVLITGGSRGLGLALAEEFARRGARLVLCARGHAALDAARARIERLGTEVLAVPTDVSRRDEVARLVGDAEARFGRIDALVTNAGVMTVGALGTQGREDFEEALGTMFWGVLEPVLAVLPGMLERGSGRIVNVTSIGGKVSAPRLLPYSSAKFAAVGLSQGLRAELAGTGIKVVTVVPGFMRTGSYVNAFVKGRARAEYAWFSLGATLPGTSISAERAARKIVDATVRGRAEVTLGPQAKLAARFAGLFPGATADLLGVMHRLLPAPGDDAARRLGRESTSAISESPLTILGRRAAGRLQQGYRPGG